MNNFTVKKAIFFCFFILVTGIGKAQNNIPYSTNQSNLTIWNGEEYIPFFVKGINLGVAVPGTFPGELAASEEQYLTWFAQIKDAGYNCIRLYTLHYPRFYHALKAYNNDNKQNPLLFIQGVWLNEDIPGYANDLYFMKDTFLMEIEENVDCVHGNKTIEARFGKAFGIYNSDVSDYCLAYLIGREVIPLEIETTNTNHANSSFNGNHFSISGGSPSEVLVTESLDHLVEYENNHYNTQRPVSFSSWPTLDPLDHPEEANPEEDSQQIDLSKINTEWAPAGLFVSYHAYPYYPDFISQQTSYNAYSDNFGPNSYIGYLTELKSHYNYPLIIAEFGVPSSWATAHYASSGMNHGGFSEFKQGNTNVRILQNIYDLGIGGGIQFSWIDEWFKRTWITDEMDFNPSDRILWNNLAAAEQNFGLIKFVDTTNLVSLADFGFIDTIAQILADATYAHLKLKIRLNHPLDILDEMWIALDTYDASLGESVLLSGDVIPDYRSEFSIYLTNYAANLYVTEAYDLYGIWHDVSEPEQLYQSVATDGNPWNLVRLKNNYLYPNIQYIGNLNVRNSDQPIQTNDAVIIYEDSIILRLPWTYINFTAPNQMQVMHDDRSTGETETMTSDGIAIAINFKDQWFKSSSRFTWSNWHSNNMENISERFKESYWVLKDILPDFNTPAIAYHDSFKFIHEIYPIYINDSDGLLKNDFDLDGNDLICLLIDPLKNGSIDLSLDGSFYYIPDPGFNGYDSLSYILYDGQDLSQEVNAIFYVEGNTTSIDKITKKKNDLILSPNPCNEYLHIKSENTIFSIKIFNSSGVLELVEDVNNNEATINVSELNAGIYYIVFNIENELYSKKLIKR